MTATPHRAADDPDEPDDPGLEQLPGLVDVPRSEPGSLVLIPYDRLHELATAAWLVEGIVPARAVSTIFADPGVGKTFIVVSLAVAIAAGIPWGDRDCGDGASVVLVIGEGLAGIPKRIAAAVKAAGLGDVSLPIHFLVEPLNLLDSMMVRRFIVALRALDPPVRCVAMDTLVTCTPGADHNSASEMAAAYEHLKLIVRETGAAVVTTDHPNNTSKTRPAGSYIKIASADAIWQAERDGERILFKATKLKDFERDPAEAVTLRLAKVTGSDSVAIKHMDAVDAAAIGHGLDRVCLKVLDDIALDCGATSTEWLAASEGGGCSRASFYRVRTRLVRGHLVEQVGQRFRLTAGGRMLVSQDSGRVL